MGERINLDGTDGPVEGHLFRYHLARGFISPGDKVLDAACGIGYGSAILSDIPGMSYLGLDRSLDHIRYPEANNVSFSLVDLSKPIDLEYDFDVFIGFETVEHLSEYDHYLDLAKRARKWVLLSAPVIPTKHMNPYHLHDFVPGEIINIFADEDWISYEAIGQPREFSEIYVFKKVEG